MTERIFKYPFLRRELLMCVQALSDKDYQREAWVNRKFPPGIEWDSLSVAVNFLFNDSGLSDDPAGAVGLFLLESEMDGIIEIMRRMDIIFEKYGDHCSDLEYISRLEWNDVIMSAKSLLALMVENNEKYKFDPSRVD